MAGYMIRLERYNFFFFGNPDSKSDIDTRKEKKNVLNLYIFFFLAEIGHNIVPSHAEDEGIHTSGVSTFDSAKSQDMVDIDQARATASMQAEYRRLVHEQGR